MSQAILIGIGIPLLLIGVMLPVGLLIAHVLSLYEAIPQEAKHAFGFAEARATESESSSRRIFLVAMVVVISKWVLERVMPQFYEWLGLVVLLVLTTYALSGVYRFFKLARSGAEVPAPLIRFARYAAAGLLLVSFGGVLLVGCLARFMMTS